jgi:hypothetical protein
MTADTSPGMQLAVLAEWAEAARTASTMVGELMHTDFAPVAHWPLPPGTTARQCANPRLMQPGEDQDQYERRCQIAVASGAAAVLYGLSLGLDPLTALQQIYLVHGRPGMYARLKVALAQRAGHEVWETEHGPTRSVVCGRRRGSTEIVTVAITIEDAERAGWTTNPQYQRIPADMLYARAAARVVDRVAADDLLGIPTVEDLGDLTPTVSTPVTVDSVTARPVLDVVPPVPAITTAVLPETDQCQQAWDAIQKKFREAGITGPGQTERRRTVISALTGGLDIQSHRDLTLDQKKAVLQALEDGGPDLIHQILTAPTTEDTAEEPHS